MRLSGRILLLTIFSVAADDGAARAQSGALSLRDLARAWSGSSVPPRCTSDVQQQRDGIPRFLTTDNCAWPVQTRGRGVMRLTGVRTPLGTLGLLTREEDVRDSAAAFRLRDSLSIALRARGFQEYQCYVDDRQWRSSHGAVHFTIGAIFPTGLLRIVMFATADARNIPSIACPDSSSRRVR